MTIQTLYRVQCQPCERYLPRPELNGANAATGISSFADLFIDFSSAYDEAVRRGWTPYPLICPDCAADLANRVRNGEVRRDDDAPEDGGRLPEGSQGPERAASPR